MAYPEDFDDEFCQCPRCSGWGEIDCHCGGDLCVCEYYGEKPCPLCHGEGEISEEYAREYERHRMQHENEMHAAWLIKQLSERKVSLTVNGDLRQVEPGEDASDLIADVARLIRNANVARSRGRSEWE